MSEPKTFEEKLAKLPAWAREHIQTLDRERSNAVMALTEFLDSQTPSPFFIETDARRMSGELGGVQEKVYVQGYAMCVEAHGVRLRISTAYGSSNDNSIVLQWEDVNRRSGEIGLVPVSFQMARLIAPEKMRQ